MEDLLAEFVAETHEMLEAIEGELIAWEADPGDRARLDAIFRFVHTVKGNCGFFDLPRLEQLSHAAEGALGEVRAGARLADSALVSAVLAIVDRIREITDAMDSGTDYPDGDDAGLIAALEPDAAQTSESTAMHSASMAKGKQPTSAGARSIRLPVELMDRVMASTSDLVLARNEMARRVRDAQVDPALASAFDRLGAMLDELREGVTRMRMQRIEHLFSSFPRLVRDLSAELDKQVMIDLDGGDAELDREMIEMIRDPLTHIVRNALDHGIESPAERRAAGKREIGMLRISARQARNRIIVAVIDDGRGIDRARLAEKAIAAGIVSAAECAAMDDDALVALVFEPGLSTAQAVTSVSGRGVGMDVVRANIEQIGGTITIKSDIGSGTRVVLSLPLTLSIVPALTLEVGGQVFAIARSYVEEIVRAGSDSLEFSMMGDTCLAKLRGERLSCIALGAVFGLDDYRPVDKSTLVLLRLAGGALFAVATDRVIDHEDLVIKPLAPVIMQSNIYAGGTLLDDGKPILMLDVTGIAQAHGLLSEVRRRPQAGELTQEAVETAAAEPALLVVGLDGRTRLVRLQGVLRIEKVPAHAIQLGEGTGNVVVDGQIMPLAGMDTMPVDDGHTNLLRLGDGGRELAFAIERVIDTAAIGHEIVPAEEAGAVEGVTLHEGQAIEVLDTRWLVGRHGRVLPETVS